MISRSVMLARSPVRDTGDERFGNKCGQRAFFSWAAEHYRICCGECLMARKYSKGASKDVERAMRKRKKGTLRSGRSGRKVKSRKQAIAIGLSEARKKGKKVPRRRK
jgi:hypothetical protein